MARERLYLFDTTLRDGAQTNGVDFTLHDKLAIAGMLDDLGIDYVEGGYPGANLTDTQLFSEDRGLKTTFTAFGMTRRPGRSTSNDPGLAGLLAHSEAPRFLAQKLGETFEFLVYSCLKDTADGMEDEGIADEPAAQAAPTQAGGVIDLRRRYGGADLRWTSELGPADRPLTLVGGFSYDTLREQRKGYQNYTGDDFGLIITVPPGIPENSWRLALHGDSPCVGMNDGWLHTRADPVVWKQDFDAELLQLREWKHADLQCRRACVLQRPRHAPGL